MIKAIVWLVFASVVLGGCSNRQEFVEVPTWHCHDVKYHDCHAPLMKWYK
jgi:hypothetical protein